MHFRINDGMRKIPFKGLIYNEMKEFWDERYANKEYVYGIEPNVFFKQEIQKLTPGRILLPAEGEGRNAVYAASLGWDVTAFDISVEGKKKADLLARKLDVVIDYRVCDFSEFDAAHERYDCVALIFVHVGRSERIQNHHFVTKWLKPNGNVILQAFSKQQLGRFGGPPNDQLLFSAEELEDDFQLLTHCEIQEYEIKLNEGLFHQGDSAVINLVGRK
jgi:2-polyprenyl-3-methyl-5-hydroxy-6-metoxy-1,4-benzoquinol methylase